MGFPRSLLGLLLVGIAWAGGRDPVPESGRTVFRSYGLKDGLLHPSITTLTQDARGFIWAGTEGGAYRFDGSGFRCWSYKDGLPASTVQAFQPLPDGSLWIATDAGLARWREGKVEQLPSEDPLAKARLHALLLDGEGRLWAAADEGLFRREAGRSVRVGAWSEGRPLALARDGEGILWVGGENGHLMGLGPGGVLRMGASEGLPLEPIKAIAEDGAGRLWVRTTSALLTRLPGATRFQRLWPDLPSMLGTIYEESLVSDGQGGLWAPTGKGLLHLPLEGRWRLLDEGRGLPTSWANAALVDRQGSLWAASVGLHRRMGSGAWTTYTHRDGLSADNVWGIAPDHQRALWVSTSLGVCRQSAHGFQVVPGTAGMTFYALKRDAQGALWGGGEQTFLVRMQGDRIERIPLSSAQGLAVVSGLAFDAHGSLWVATAHQGLHRVARKGGRWICERVALKGLRDDGMTGTVMVDPAGRVWVTGDHGLAVHTAEGWLYAQGLPHPRGFALALMPDGSAWISFGDALGMAHLALEDKRLRVLERRTTAEGLLSDSVYSLGCDARGRLWVGTNRGLQRWEGTQSRTFDRFSGLGGQDCNPWSFASDASGDVWVGTTGGLLHYAPMAEGAASPAPTVLLSECTFGSVRWKGTSEEGSHPYAERTLEVRFSCLDFRQEGSLRFQVRLVGLEDAWRDTEERLLRYPGLAPGTYRLEVRAAGETGVFGPVTALGFQIRPPWWRTWPAGLLGLLAAGLLLRVWIRRRTRRLKQRTTELEALVQARTEALEYANLALHAAARTDPLTQLRNRRHVEEILPMEISRVIRQHRAKAEGHIDSLGPDACRVFVMLDVDHFKRINDTYGHAAGDEALMQLAEVLRRQARETDLVVRWGGEEFLLIAPVDDLESARGFVERLRVAVAHESFDLGTGDAHPLTCSLGFACFPFSARALEAEDWGQVVDLADRCLYAAKRSGRNGWVGIEALSDAPENILDLALEDPQGESSGGRVRIIASETLRTPLAW